MKKRIEYEVEGSNQEVNQKGCGERLCKKILPSTQIELGGCCGSL